MPERLDEVEHRVLASLPVWRDEQAAARAARLEMDGHSPEEVAALKGNPTSDDEREGGENDPRVIAGTGTHVTSYTVAEFLERLSHDGPLVDERPRPGLPPLPPLLWEMRGTTLTAECVATELANLEAKGLAAVDGDGRWTMTEQGRQALGV